MPRYIDARLLVLIPVLYAVGAAIKKSRVSDWLIPYILGIAGIVLSVAYIFASEAPAGFYATAGALFSAVTQGVLCAAASVYADNLIRQAAKRDEDCDEKDRRDG